MHRMRYLVRWLGLVSWSLALVASPAAADLLRPDAKRSFPDIAADINGRIDFEFDDTTQTGTFQMSNTPFLIAGGPTSDSEFAVLPNSDGVRSQSLTVRLDTQGRVVEHSDNRFEMRGRIVTDTGTFDGVLLAGTPTEFGFLDLGPLSNPTTDPMAASEAPMLGVDIFDTNIEVTGGELAPFFGGTAYLRITPELESTFQGRFTESFSALKATSNVRSYNPQEPFPIPEPSAIAVLIVGGAAVLWNRHGRRRRRAA